MATKCNGLTKQPKRVFGHLRECFNTALTQTRLEAALHEPRKHVSTSQGKKINVLFHFPPQLPKHSASFLYTCSNFVHLLLTFFFMFAHEFPSSPWAAAFPNPSIFPTCRWRSGSRTKCRAAEVSCLKGRQWAHRWPSWWLYWGSGAPGGWWGRDTAPWSPPPWTPCSLSAGTSGTCCLPPSAGSGQPLHNRNKNKLSDGDV